MTACIVDPLPSGVDAWLVEEAERAGLRASQPPEQLELDGWLLRLLPGKAKRARCVNALRVGERSLDDKLAACVRLYREAGLPLFVRITPFSAPAELDGVLAARGWRVHDATRVLVHPALADVPVLALPDGLVEEAADAQGYARAVGALRGSTALEIDSHIHRLQASPVPYQGRLWRQAGPPGPPGDPSSGAVLACAQVARDGELVGLYDVYTAPAARGRGWSTALCARVLRQAHAQGARLGYLQVDADNAAALKVYRRLGFVEAYRYHYRLSPQDEASTH
ncbi:MAG: GNAT family N-acetyltransferase [Rubrivivax sp.]